ncbi:thiol reductase thioredoxin [Bacillus sp. MKU004]|nr:thiol reductase thioredoxin [Bacillus sp. MKU004]
MNEVSNERALYDAINTHELAAVYLYTPMCGTCQVAGRMLDIVEKLPHSFHFEKVNLNYLPQFAEEQSIESVPCLLLYKNTKEIERIYAFQSVPYLYDMMKKTETFTS